MKIYKRYLESFETATFFSVSHYSQVCILHTCVYIYLQLLISEIKLVLVSMYEYSIFSKKNKKKIYYT